MDIIQLQPLLRKFKERFFNGQVTEYGWQYLFDTADDVIYSPIKCSVCSEYRCNKHPRTPLNDQMLMEHFSEKPVSFKGGKKGCLAVTAVQNGRFKWFVVDSDNESSTHALLTKFCPVLKKYNIDYIYEAGSKSYKCHIWFMVDCSIEVLQDFTYQLFEEADIQFDSRDRELDLEIYPTNKPNSLIRIPGGIHLRNGEINPISYGGVTSSNIEFILKTFINIKQYTEEEIKALLKPISRKRSQEKKTVLAPVKVIERDLPFDYEYPKELEPVVKNCQAINKLLTKIYGDRELNRRGFTTHNLGLFLANVCKVADKLSNSSVCTDWFLGLLESYRDRDAESHKWLNMSQSAGRIPYCATWHREFGLCDGCPYLKQQDFHSPRQLLMGGVESFKPTKIANLNLKSVEEIRSTTFNYVKNRVYEYVFKGIQKDILLASPMGSGKSVLADEMAAELAKQGKYTLIAVPTAELALEHRQRLLSRGVEPFVLMSHENLFKKDNGKRRLEIDFDCPKEEEIKYLSDLGVPASNYRKAFCGPCPFRESCPYPGQYTRAAEGDSKVVIIQHAHLSCKETIYQLLSKKHFDLMIIDEEFIDSLVSEFKITEEEILVLESFGLEISWVERVVKWMRGEDQEFKIVTVKQNELETIKNKFDEKLLPWNLPEYLSHYNYKHKYNKESGLFIFYPLPNISVRIFTDATPPVDILKIVLNVQDMEVFGQNEVMNYLEFNPENRIIQVLNSSTSKTSMQKEDHDKFYKLLDGIGKLVKYKYSGVKVLLVTYAGEHEKMARRFFRLNYPDLLEQLVITHMSIGTNRYEDCRVLFQLAGVHLNTKQLSFMAYKIKSIENFWHRMNGEPEVDNEYPSEVTETSPISLKSGPIVRAEVGEEGPGYYRYPDMYKAWYPEDPYFYWCYQLSLAKRQQAMRLRFHDGQERHGYLFDSASRNTLLVTGSMLLEDFID